MSEGFQGLDRAIRRIAQMATDVKHVEKPLNEAGEYAIGSIKKNFLVGGRPSKWKALAASTIAGRRRGKGRGGIKILIDRARLMNAITKKTVASGGGAGVAVGENVIYAPRQHFGYKGGTGRGHAATPARPFMMLQQPEDVNAIGKIFSRHVARK